MNSNAVVVVSKHDYADSKTAEASETMDGVSLETKQSNEHGDLGLELADTGAVVEANRVIGYLKQLCLVSPTI